jgi:hypothetical protein
MEEGQTIQWSTTLKFEEHRRDKKNRGEPVALEG